MTEESILVVVFPKLSEEEQKQWERDIDSLTSFNERVKKKFFDKRDEAMYYLQTE